MAPLVVAVAAFLWDDAGAFTIMMAQARRLYDLEPGERAYYAAQPVWLVILTDMSLVAAVAASMAMLLRGRAAVQLFAFSFAAILITNGYELATGTSRMLVMRDGERRPACVPPCPRAYFLPARPHPYPAVTTNGVLETNAV